MKVILDAQLPTKLKDILTPLGFDVTHVEELPNGDCSTDNEIIAYAETHNLVVVSKDINFYHSHMVLGKPKRLLLITTGNIKNKQLFDLFRNHFMLILSSLRRNTFIELNNDGIIEHR